MFLYLTHMVLSLLSFLRSIYMYPQNYRYLVYCQWGTTDIQSCPIKLPPLFHAPAVWVVPVWLICRLMREWSFYIRGFIYTSSYSCPTNWWLHCIYDLPLYDTLYIIDLQCTFSVGVTVSSLIQISTRSATINKPKGADKG